eukprot:CAMPEP_0202474728 /NCGR_PEP_ID=MMETSP1360-20130828/92535_1 /ASSEMBLY_ACC=CAM_ASM_000848 /TAXON_ID=515479 /ORGANISM="Licmophora paradoxa, Strain CCMP2313" /LENGTH=389 /DNA_ID=CAMNT_0049101865 /DNA_START=29 /DNA_END=1198 /DNA_ORIENTATION=+
MTDPSVSSFFSHSGHGMCSIYQKVFHVVFKEWQVFFGLFFIQSGVLVLFFLTFLAIFAGAFGLSSLLSVFNGRRLVEDAMEAGHRMLTDYESYTRSNDDLFMKYSDGDDFNSSSASPIVGRLLAVLSIGAICLTIFFILGCTVLTASFRGAFIRLVADVIAGQKPTVRNSLKTGWKSTWKIICFDMTLHFGLSFGLLLVYLVVLLLSSLLVAVLGQAGAVPAVLFALVCEIGAIVLIIIITCGMIGGLPAIVVQGHEVPTEAIKSSWELCKGNICDIFCTCFCFYLVETIVKTILNIVVRILVGDSGAGMFVFVIFSLILISFLYSLNSILAPVIYLSLRVQNNGLTMSALQQELNVDVMNGIELGRTEEYSRPGFEKSDPLEDDSPLV